MAILVVFLVVFVLQQARPNNAVVEFTQSRYSGEEGQFVTVCLTRPQAESGQVTTVELTTVTIQSYAEIDRLCSLSLTELGISDISIVDPAELSDFDSTVQTVTFGGTETDHQITIALPEDDVAEGSELFVVLLNTTSNSCAALVNITDNDVVTFKLSRQDLEIFEDEDTSDLLLSIIKEGQNEQNITIEIAVVPSAIQGTDSNDYVFSQTSFTFTSDTNQLDIPYFITNDNIAEDLERFSIRLLLPLVNQGGTRVELGEPNSTSIVLLDNDSVLIGFDQIQVVQLQEEGPENSEEVCIVFQQLGRTLDPQESVTIRIDRPPASLADFTLIPDGSQTLDLINPDFCFNITTIDDTDEEGTESFRLTLVIENTGASIPLNTFPSTLDIEIMDSTVLNFMLGPCATEMQDGSTSIPVIEGVHYSDALCLQLQQPTFSTEIVRVTLAIQYTGVQESEVDIQTIIDFNTSISERPIPFEVQDDSTSENLRTLTTQIQSLAIVDTNDVVGMSFQEDQKVTINIYDNDIEVGFQMDSVSIREGLRAETLVVAVLKPTKDISPDFSTTVSITVDQASKANVTEVNIRISPSVVTLTAEQKSRTIIISVMDNDICDGRYTLILEGTDTASTAPYRVTYTGNSEVIIINNNDDCPLDGIIVIAIAVSVGVLLLVIIVALLIVIACAYWRKRGWMGHYDPQIKEEQQRELNKDAHFLI